MSSGKSKTTGPLKFTLNLSEKINLKKSDIMFLYQALYQLIKIKKTWKNLTKTINLEC